MRLGAFELQEPLPELREPHALAMLQPWIDIGSVGTLALSWLESRLQAKELARLARPGDFFDFTRYRPTIYFQEGRRLVSIPNTYLTYGKQETGNDFLFLHLLEPHCHGELYVESMLQLLERFVVKRYCLLGSMYDLVPHTRPLLITGSAVGKGAEEEFHKMGIQPSDYQGPTTITSLVSQSAPEMGIETMSLIVHLPQYTQLDENFMGTVTLMKMLNSLYHFPMDESYLKKAEEQLAQLNLALDQNPELRAAVEQLEVHYEARTKRAKEEAAPPLSPEVEKFLREMERRFRQG